VRKQKRTTPEEWAHVQARLARLEAREQELRELVETGVAEMARRTAEGHPTVAPRGSRSSVELR
jgi:hypothetical protein